ERNQKRSRASVEAIELFELSDVSRVPDGTYRASSLGYEAPVAVEIVVRDRRLASVRVTSHREKQFYSALSDTPAKILAKPGAKGGRRHRRGDDPVRGGPHRPGQGPGRRAEVTGDPGRAA